MSLKPQHYFLTTALVTYVKSKQLRQRHMNVVCAVEKKEIRYSTLASAKASVREQLLGEAGIAADMVKDITFLSFNYLGHMKPDEFYDSPEFPRGRTATH